VAAWLKRFGLHLAAAVGATGIFVAAAAVGANQTRDPTVAPAVPSPSTIPAKPATQRILRVVPERSLAGTVKEVLADTVIVGGVGGRAWRVTPAPGALIRLNGKAAKLETLQAGDALVILGQAQAGPGPGNRFLAHAITARRK
jgi:hypothetical protein